MQSQNSGTPAAELLEQSLQQPRRKKKKDFIESLRHKRLLHLDRAAFCEELIQELGGEIEEPMVDEMAEDLDMPQQEEQPRRRGGQNHSQGRENDRSGSGREMSNRDEGEGRPRNKDGSPDLRYEENFDIRAEEGQEGGGENRSSSRGSQSRRGDERRSVGEASREEGSSPEAEGDAPDYAVTKDGSPDKRYKANETEAEYKARHMMEVPEGETDGRGEVTDPENDLRLKRNLGKRAAIAQQQQLKRVMVKHCHLSASN
jgi:hypothetical protein